MNIWAIVAIIAALIFGVSVGYLAGQYQAKKTVDDLLKCCKETNDKLAALSDEYDEFVKAANEVDRWPKNNPHIVMKDNLADYLKNKYRVEETENGRYSRCVEETSDWDDCEDEPDNLYI